MSYTIVYDKVCLKVAEDQYIPMILSGDNNVYSSSPFSKREKRARNWTFFHFPYSTDKRKVVFSRDELIIFSQKKNHPDYDEDVFMERNKFIKESEFPIWMERYINKAMTLDELKKENSYLSISLVFRDEFGGAIYSASANDSSQLLEILNEYETYFSPTEKNSTYLKFYGCGDSPLKKRSKSSSTGQVVGRKNSKQPAWIKSYTKDTIISFTSKPEEAIVFESEDDMWEKLGYRWRGVKAVSYESCKKNMIERNYVIYVDGNGYFSKLSSKSLFYTPCVSNAKKFTEKEALKKIEEIKDRGYKSLLKPVCLSVKEEK